MPISKHGLKERVILVYLVTLVAIFLLHGVLYLFGCFFLNYNPKYIMIYILKQIVSCLEALEFYSS